MELDPRDTQDLARFFAKRFPLAEDRAALMARTRLSHREEADADVLSTWTILLARVRDAGRLPALARAARGLHPEDANLQAVCEILAARRWPDPRLLVPLAAAASLLLGVGAAAGAWALLWDGSESDVVVAAAPEADAPTYVSVNPTAAAPARPALKAAAVTAAPEASPAPKAEAPQKIAPANVDGRCTAGPGEVVGYWYAGSDLPGHQGETITMDGSMNVRADYPDHRNGYSVKSAIRCTLRVGDRVRLSREPMVVPGDAVWVPLVTGDLLSG